MHCPVLICRCTSVAGGERALLEARACGAEVWLGGEGKAIEGRERQGKGEGGARAGRREARGARRGALARGG